MKKIIFYIPAINFTILYGFLAINNIGVILPIVIVSLALFFISGFILSRTPFWVAY